MFGRSYWKHALLVLISAGIGSLFWFRILSFSEPFLFGQSQANPLCRGSLGDGHPDLGSGACSGNYAFTFAISSTVPALHYNSDDESSIDYGFGTRWRPEWSMSWSNVSNELTTANGTKIPFIAQHGGYRNQDDRQGNFVIMNASGGYIHYDQSGTKTYFTKYVHGSYHVEKVEPRSGAAIEFIWNGDRVVSIKNSQYPREIKINYQGSNVVITDQASRDHILVIGAAGIDRIIRPGSQQANFYYGGPGARISSWTSYFGETTNLAYEQNGAISSILNSAKSAVKFVYQTDKVSASTTSGEIVTEEFDTSISSEPKIISSTINGQETYFDRESGGLRRIVATHPFTKDKVTYTYLNSLTTTISVTKQNTYEVRTQYSSLSGAQPAYLLRRVISTTESDGAWSRSVSYTWSGFDVTKITNNGRSQSYEYSNGNITKVTDWRGVVAFEANNGAGGSYDSQGHLLGIKDAGGGIAKFEYDFAGRLSKYTNKLGNWQTYDYHANGKLAHRSTWNTEEDFSYGVTGRLLEHKFTKDGVTTTKKWDYSRHASGRLGSKKASTLRNDVLVSEITTVYEDSPANSVVRVEQLGVDGTVAVLFDTYRSPRQQMQPEVIKSLGSN